MLSMRWGSLLSTARDSCISLDEAIILSASTRVKLGLLVLVCFRFWIIDFGFLQPMRQVLRTFQCRMEDPFSRFDGCLTWIESCPGLREVQCIYWELSTKLRDAELGICSLRGFILACSVS